MSDFSELCFIDVECCTFKKCNSKEIMMIFLIFGLYAADLMSSPIKTYIPNLSSIGMAGIFLMNLVGATGLKNGDCCISGNDYAQASCKNCPESSEFCGDYSDSCGVECPFSVNHYYRCCESHTGTILAAVFGTIGGIALICCVLCCCYYKFHKSEIGSSLNQQYIPMMPVPNNIAPYQPPEKSRRIIRCTSPRTADRYGAPYSSIRRDIIVEKTVYNSGSWDERYVENA